MIATNLFIKWQLLLAIIAVLLIVPLIPALVKVMQGKNKFSMLTHSYLSELISLLFSLCFILVILPYIALQITWVGSLIMLLVAIVGLIAECFKANKPFDTGWLYICLYCLVAAIVLSIILFFAKSNEDRFIAYLRNLKNKIVF